MAKYHDDKKRLLYSSSQEFLEIQASRGATDAKFNIKEKPHIAVDVNRMLKFIHKEDRILDAGCRDAWAMGYLASKGYTDVKGFDIISENVDICKRHGFDVDEAAAEDLSIYRARSFEVVFSRHMLEHVIEPHMAIIEFARIIRHGGILYCVIPLQKAGTTPKVKYGHSYVFNSIDEVANMSKNFFKQISCIKREHSKSGLAATFVGQRL